MSSLLKHTFSLLFIFGLTSVADAVTARPGVMPTGKVASVTASGRRMPTVAAALTNATNTATATVVTTSSLMDDTKCVDEYLTCIKAPEVCGSGFEECTNKVLFHAKMPQCISTLYQCTSGGINKLFGTSDMNALSRVATTNEYNEVTDYTYPTDSSALGQLITAGAIDNMYNTTDCVRRYTTCLNRENVCGTDFELCTTYNDFKKQRVGCDSVLARCQSDGLKELFGTASRTTQPSDDSRVGTMIADGATLAAINAVSTCYRVVDQCILNACTKNPYKCYENTPAGIIATVQSIKDAKSSASLDENITTVLTKSDINKYIRSECMDTIGQNKYCFMTFNDGRTPSKSDLSDEFNQEDIFSQAYSTRMNSGMVSKINDMVNEFDTDAKNKCTETIRSCAMRVCGGGSGAACYKLASSDGINGENTYKEIERGCAAIINTDPNCVYAAQNPTSAGTFKYIYNNGDAFSTLFTKDDSDPIGVIANLNATLNTSYNDAAIAQLKKQCQTLATSCVKSMCGEDYINCYRNRTDMMSNLTDTGTEIFDNSMNKVGGVLDYTIVLGLCVNTVKNSDVCAEHLAIEKVKMENTSNNYASSWGESINDTTVRSGWYDAGSATKLTAKDEIIKTDEDGNKICTNSINIEGICNTVADDGSEYNKPVIIGYETYVQDQVANSLFKDLIYDLEREAQAKYNAKLTKEQNMCLSSNSGGILGTKDTGSTYMWVKLKNKNVPQNYAISGLKPDQFVASNDLYGSFCRIRVTLQSDDKYIQDAIKNNASWSQAYFALGDTFTCGSWLSTADLEALADQAGKAARVATGLEDESGKATDKANRQRWWTTIATGLASGTGGAFLGNGIANGKTLGGLTGNKDKKKKLEQNLKLCRNYADEAYGYFEGNNSADKIENEKYAEWQSAITNAKTAVNYADSAQVNPSIRNSVTNAVADKTIWKGWTNQSSVNDAQVAATAASAAATALKALKEACDEDNYIDEDDKSWFQNWGGAVTIGTGTALLGGFTTYKIVQSAQDTKLDKAEQEAYQEFMDNIGSKIRCFIGADEVGTYGDMISTQME